MQAPVNEDGWTVVGSKAQSSSNRGGRAHSRGSHSSANRKSRPRAQLAGPTLGVEDSHLMGEGDCALVQNLLPPDLAAIAFEQLRDEVKWNTMYHRGGEVPRLVAVEGEVDADGSIPIYRHPADESPPLHAWSPTVAKIRAHVEASLGQPVNHVLIQLYRTGSDYISEHSDKTIDVVRGSRIVNVSLGARRVMTLRMKRYGARALAEARGASHAAGDEEEEERRRPSQRIPLPHNSMFVLGLETNKKWLHGINQDKRPLSMKDTTEWGERISLTFRQIGTFLSVDGTWIWGQGARGKTRDKAGETLWGTGQAGRLIREFGYENQDSWFDWDKHYGEGFDVLHFSDSVKDELDH